MNLADLNPEQRKAAETLDGPVLVTAGAGSGKTRMLVARYSHAVTGEEALPVDGVVAITFTEKAAGELAERLRIELRDAGLPGAARAIDTAWISTIHGLCSRILRENALELGVDPSFRVLGETERRAIEEEAFEHVVATALRDSDAATRLFGSYEFGDVQESVRALSSALRARGLDTTRCRVCAPAPLGRTLERSIQAFTDVDAALAGAGIESEIVEPLREQVGRVIVGLTRLAGDPSPSPDDVMVAITLLSGAACSSRRQKLKEACEAFAAAKASATAELAASWTFDLEREVVRIAGLVMDEVEVVKRARGALDFEDLQLSTARLLRERTDLAARYRERFGLVMVDEFQDTDALQLEIVESLAGDSLCSVGDARQSIYGFRGADLGVYEQHLAQMRAAGATEAVLFENYRSHGDVLNFVNAFFGMDDLFGSELVALSASRDKTNEWWDAHGLPASAPRVEVALVPRGPHSQDPERRTSARDVAERLRELGDAGVPQGDMVVLLRTLTHVDTYVDALEEAGLRAVVLGGSRFLKMREVAMLEVLVRALANPHDEEALGALLASEIGNLPDDVLAQLRSTPGERLWAALTRASEFLEGEHLACAHKVALALEKARRRLGSAPLSHVLLEAIEALDYDLLLLSQGQHGAESLANVLKFLRLADEFEATGGVGARAFAEHVRMKREANESEAPAANVDERTDAVRILTIHGSKGLEFPVVVVPELGNGSARGDNASIRLSKEADGCLAVALRIPSEAAGGTAVRSDAFERADAEAKDKDLAEYQRLLYVAFTRARELLILAGTGSPKSLDGLRPNAVWWLRQMFGLVDALESPRDEDRTVAAGGSESRVRLRVLEVDAPAEEERPEAPDQSPAVLEAACALPEAEAEVTPAAPQRLSYSHISLYRACPQRFLAQQVLGIRQSDKREAGSARVFGDALHAAMDARAEDGDGSASGASAPRLAAIARYFGLDDEAAERLEAAVSASASADAVREARSLRYSASEVPFAVRVGEGDDGFLLFGFMDLYGSDGDVARIVDYKSGAPDDVGSLRDRYRLQAECYAIPALADGAKTVTVTFVLPELLERDGVVTSVDYEFTQDDRAAIESALFDEWESMAQGRYTRRAEWDEFTCGECPLRHSLCDVEKPVGER